MDSETLRVKIQLDGVEKVKQQLAELTEKIKNIDNGGSAKGVSKMFSSLETSAKAFKKELASIESQVKQYQKALGGENSWNN